MEEGLVGLEIEDITQEITISPVSTIRKCGICGRALDKDEGSLCLKCDELHFEAMMEQAYEMVDLERV